MHIISFKKLRDFFHRHRKAEGMLREWHTIVEHAEFTDFHEVRESFNSASSVGQFTVFNVGGNNYRLIAVIRYEAKKVFVRHVFTHSEYDKWCKRFYKGLV